MKKNPSKTAQCAFHDLESQGVLKNIKKFKKMSSYNNINFIQVWLGINLNIFQTATFNH